MKYIQAFKLGEVTIIPSEYFIEFPNGERVKVQGKFIHVLAFIAANHTRVVTREDLIETIWNGNIYVGEKALTNAIWQIRAIFRDQGIDSKVVETIRGVGYRLIESPQYIEESLPDSNNGIANEKPLRLTKNHLVIAVLILFTCLSFVFYNQPTPIKTFHTPELVTNTPGTESYAAPSPDGFKLVYRKKYKNANTDLILLDLISKQEIQLTNDSHHEGITRWSPHSNIIYYSRKTKNKKQCEIVSLNLDTKEIKQLARCNAGSSYTYMDISPDGKTLAYLGPKYEYSSTGIYFLDLTKDDALPKRWSCHNACVFKDRDISFSPDGVHLAVTKRVSSLNEDIYIVNMETKQSRQLTKGENDISGMAWHPDGDSIVYASRTADLRAGYIIDITSLETIKLPTDGFRFPSFAAKSGELFFETKQEFQGVSKIAYLQESPSFPDIVIGSEFSYLSPDYADKHEKTAYISNASGHYELWTMDKDGTNREMLTRLKKRVSYPKWSHRQDRIVFMVKEKLKPGNSLYIYDLNSQQTTKVDSPFESHGRPSWNYNDTAIYSAITREDYKDIFEIPLNSATQKRITFDGGRFAQALSDNQILYTRRGRGLWLKQLASEDDGELILDKKLFKDRYSWNVDNNTIYYKKNRRTHYELRLFNFATKESSEIAHIPIKIISRNGSLAVNSKDKIIYFPSEKYPQGNIYRLKIK